MDNVGNKSPHTGAEGIAEMAKQAKQETPGSEAPTPEIVRVDGGVFIPDEFVMSMVDSTTDREWSVPIGEVTPAGVGYTLGYGWKQSVADCHSQIVAGRKVGGKDGKMIADGDVVPMSVSCIETRIANIKAGKMVGTGGGRKADTLTIECVTIARIAAGVGIAKFTDTYGRGMDAVHKYALKAVRDAFANAGVRFKATDATHAAKVTEAIVGIEAKAKANIANRAGPKIDVSDIVADAG
jgi:hypothetical protein